MSLAAFPGAQKDPQGISGGLSVCPWTGQRLLCHIDTGPGKDFPADEALASTVVFAGGAFQNCTRCRSLDLSTTSS